MKGSIARKILKGYTIFGWSIVVAIVSFLVYKFIVELLIPYYWTTLIVVGILVLVAALFFLFVEASVDKNNPD